MTPRLTKSLFLDGLECGKRLWLRVHLPELAEGGSPAPQRLLDDGARLGAWARDRYPGGVWSPADVTAAIEAGATTLYEAGVGHSDCYARADVLVREGSGWTLVEAKSSTQVKPKHVQDAAFQVFVFRGAGVDVQRVRLLHLNKDYRRRGELDVEALLTETDVTEQVEELMSDTSKRARDLLGLWGCREEPTRGGVWPALDPGLGSMCGECAFSAHCGRSRHPMDLYYFLHHSRLKKARAAGVDSVDDLVRFGGQPSPEEQRKIAFSLAEETWVSDDLGRALARLEFPVRCIDFETMQSMAPLFDGLGPHAQVCVQWSCHTLAGPPGSQGWQRDQTPHAEFLHREPTDPRAAFCSSLLEAIGDSGSVLIYSKFESTRIREMAAQGAPCAAELDARLEKRGVDLLEVVAKHIYVPSFRNRTSIKVVLPALAPELSYEGLPIGNGTEAMEAYTRAVYGATDPSEREAIFSDLLDYCELDTWAMVAVLGALYRVSQG